MDLLVPLHCTVVQKQTEKQKNLIRPQHNLQNQQSASLSSCNFRYVRLSYSPFNYWKMYIFLFSLFSSQERVVTQQCMVRKERMYTCICKIPKEVLSIMLDGYIKMDL
ncbi:hypothetical protein GJAV_G00196380 [Gymnothorax javanicus]|nr:hypothetical protein GJAV_G00196380 [Gymnothorax javanicus]